MHPPRAGRRKNYKGLQQDWAGLVPVALYMGKEEKKDQKIRHQSDKQAHSDQILVIFIYLFIFIRSNTRFFPDVSGLP